MLSRLAPALRVERRRLGVPDEQESDLIQTLALLALQSAERIRNPPAWLWGTFRNLCRIEVRERFRWEAVRARLAWEARARAGSQDDSDRAIELEQRLAPVRQRSRRALELHYVEGLTLEETARQLGFAVSSMKRTLHRALRVARHGRNPD